MSSLRLPQVLHDNRTNVRKSSRVRTAPSRYAEQVSNNEEHRTTTSTNGNVVSTINDPEYAPTSTRKRKRTQPTPPTSSSPTHTTTTNSSSVRPVPTMIAQYDINSSHPMNMLQNADLFLRVGRQLPALSEIIDLTSNNDDNDNDNVEMVDSSSGNFPRNIGFLVTPRMFIHNRPPWHHRNSGQMMSIADIVRQHNASVNNSNNKHLMNDDNILTNVLTKDISDANSDDCSICLEGYKRDQKVAFIRNCTHRFHHHCLSDWFSKGGGAECPICKTNVS